nr:RNA-directed DNA polymerase, eukaryota, nucleotide-binding alpha-beta plait domain protein [Tanacetum cinerariifolium]
MWVLIELESSTTSQKFIKHAGVGSWFSSLQPASNSFVSDERIVWISIEGLSLKVWSFNTFMKTKLNEIICERFKVIIQGNVHWVRAKEMEGWDPLLCNEDYASSSSDEENEQENEGSRNEEKYESDKEVDNVSESSWLGHKTKKGWINELCMKNKVNFVSLQETKMEHIELVTINKLWGNYSYDYAFNSSLDFMKCSPITFRGNKGAVGLIRWIEKTEMVFTVATLGIEAVTRKTVKEMDISSYTTHFNELVILCPGMVPTERKKVEAYIRGLSENIKGEVTLSEPITLNKAVRMAHTIMKQKVKAIAEREADNKKRKDSILVLIVVTVVIVVTVDVVVVVVPVTIVISTTTTTASLE